MLLEKKPLGVEEIEAQTALELPDRELMALLDLDVTTGDIALCANVNVIGSDVSQSCEAQAG